MPSWYIFTLLRLTGVLFIARPKLDTVRILMIVALLEIPYFYLWREGVVANYSVDYGWTPDPVGVFGEWFSWIFQLGVFHIGILIMAARFHFFSGQDQPRFYPLQALWVAPLFFGLHLIQRMIANSTSSTGL